MKGRTYYLQTFGCQMNEHDSETIGGLLQAQGYRKVLEEKEADLILLNTCCIREKAESKVLSLLGSYKGLVKAKPDLIIGVCGCMVQQKDIIPVIQKAAPFVRLMVGTNHIHEIPGFVKALEEGEEVIVRTDEDPEALDKEPVLHRAYPFKAFVNIIYGCNNFCTYCIVPHVRGRERSRPKDHILAEVRALVADGVKEITLLGQNVNSYGNDLGLTDAFPDLLQAIDGVEGLDRIRFMTSHPKDFSNALITTIAQGRAICPSVHLPVQSGSDRILKRMNRGYTQAHYLDLLRRIRQAMPDIVVTTDLIVGFPGEEEEDFQATLDLVEAARYDNAFSFAYSRRPGTAAAEWKDQALSLEVKKDRLARLNARLAAWSKKNNEKILGHRVKVLVEGVSKNNMKMVSGRDPGGKTVIFEGTKNLYGQILDVEITSAQTWVLKGRQV